jgi:hypothetical protein
MQKGVVAVAGNESISAGFQPELDSTKLSNSHVGIPQITAAITA